jgi:Major Facilitator Superfamily
MLLALGQGASTIGDGCYAVALPWYVLASRGSAGLLGVTLAAYGLARAAAMPVGGMLADRLGPRQVLLAIDAARCLLLAAMTAIAASGPASPATLLPVAVLAGACNGAFTPGSYAVVPSLAGSGLQAANAMLTGATQLGSLPGPVAGAALVTQAGPASAFAADAATFAVSAITLALIRTPPPAAATPAPRPGLRQVVAGAAALPTMLTVVLAGNIAAAGTFAIALPVLARDRYGAGGYGAVLAALAAGALTGTLLASSVKTTRPAVFASAAFLAQAAALAVIPYTGGPAAVAAAAALFGLANSIGELVIITAVQRTFPPAMLGRVMGLIMLSSAGAFPLSVALTTFAVNHLGTAAAFPLAGGLSASAIAWGLSRRHYRDFGRTATTHGQPTAR